MLLRFNSLVAINLTAEEEAAAIMQLETQDSSSSPASSRYALTQDTNSSASGFSPLVTARKKNPDSSSGAQALVDLDNLDDLGVVSVEDHDDGNSDDDNLYDFHRQSKRIEKPSHVRKSLPSRLFSRTKMIHPVTATKGGKLASWCDARCGFHLDKNKKSEMEDTLKIVTKLVPSKSHSIFRSVPPTSSALFAAVYDGHGGVLVANILQEKLHRALAAHTDFPENLEKAIHDTCLEIDRSFLCKAAMYLEEKQKRIDAGDARQSLMRTKSDRREDQSIEREYQVAGSTAVMALLTVTADTPRKRILTTAWVGDSRAVLSRNGDTIVLSNDHKPTRPDEKERVRKANGTVNRKGQVNNTLAVSRSFGDIMHAGHELSTLTSMKPAGSSPNDDEILSSGIIIPVPEFTKTTLTEEDEFVVLASDGIFDVLSNQQVVDIVRVELSQHQDVQLATEALVSQASRRSVDNISAVVVALRT